MEPNHKFTPHEMDQLVEQALDPRRTILSCAKHAYAATDQPPRTLGCKDCWMAWYVTILAKTPPHKREEELAKLEGMIAAAAELAAEGLFDVELYDRPKIVIDKG